MTDKITQLEEMVAVLKSLPDFLWAELENNPESIDTYQELISRVHQASMSAMLSEADLNTVKLTKYGSSQDQQNFLKQMGAEVSEADFLRSLEQFKTTPISEMKQLIEEQKETRKARRTA